MHNNMEHIMERNPFASLFYQVFMHNFPEQPETVPSSPQENKFLFTLAKHLNSLFEKAAPAGEKPLHINEKHHPADIKKLKNFALSLRAIMIAGSRYIPNIKSKDSISPEIIALFDNIGGLLAKTFPKYSTIYDYSAFQQKGTALIPAQEASPRQKNIFVFGVSRDDENNPQNAEKNLRHYLKDLLESPVLKQENMQIYNTCFPTAYPEEIAVPEMLGTINSPELYNEADLIYVEKYWHQFLGKNLSFDEDGKITGGKPHSPEKFSENMKNMVILGYCAGAANAHRCLKAFKSLAQQLYTPEETAAALKNINFISYAFMPLEQNPDYHQTAILCNSKDENNPEATVRCNFPEIYEKVHLTGQDIGKAKFTPHNGKDGILALELPAAPVIYDSHHNKISKEINDRNGHRWQNVTAKNNRSPNFAAFQTIIRMAVNGTLNNNSLKKIAMHVNQLALEKISKTKEA